MYFGAFYFPSKYGGEIASQKEKEEKCCGYQYGLAQTGRLEAPPSEEDETRTLANERRSQQSSPGVSRAAGNALDSARSALLFRPGTWISA
jgi:hypothetical protein